MVKYLKYIIAIEHFLFILQKNMYILYYKG